MDTGHAVREARRQSGRSQAEIAELCGTSQATLSAYERGRKTPSTATFDRILEVCGVQLSVTPSRSPIRVPSRSDLATAARTLEQVLELAAMLPAKHSPAIEFPPIPRGPA